MKMQTTSVFSVYWDSNDPQDVLLRLFREEAPFVIGDPTGMPRPQAKKTEYVGRLSDIETSGSGCFYWQHLIMDVPYPVVL